MAKNHQGPCEYEKVLNDESGLLKCLVECHKVHCCQIKHIYYTKTCILMYDANFKINSRGIYYLFNNSNINQPTLTTLSTIKRRVLCMSKKPSYVTTLQYFLIQNIKSITDALYACNVIFGTLAEFKSLSELKATLGNWNTGI